MKTTTTVSTVNPNRNLSTIADGSWVEFQMIIERTNHTDFADGTCDVSVTWNYGTAGTASYLKDVVEADTIAQALGKLIKVSGMTLISMRAGEVHFVVPTAYDTVKAEIEADAANYVGVPEMAGGLPIDKVEFKTSDYEGIVGRIRVGANQAAIVVELKKAFEEAQGACQASAIENRIEIELY